VTYQIWAWFETFEGNVNQTNTVNFDAHWTSGAKKGGFEISPATDSNRLVVKFPSCNVTNNDVRFSHGCACFEVSVKEKIVPHVS